MSDRVCSEGPHWPTVQAVQPDVLAETATDVRYAPLDFGHDSDFQELPFQCRSAPSPTAQAFVIDWAAML